MADIRDCAQCGTWFVPRREHARFCCAGCRAVWNREHTGDPAAETSALVWSLTAMNDTTRQLPQMRAWDRPRAFAVIGEAVWWVTIVDATLVRHHPEAYDTIMGGHAPGQRELIEGTLAGLRFVRNRIGGGADLAGLIEPGPDSAEGCITGWTWKPVPDPPLAPLSPRGRVWELTRYRAYQAHLTGHTIGATFGRVVELLKVAAAAAPPIADPSVHATHGNPAS